MNELISLWNITEMGNFDKDYFNMEVQAYIKIGKKDSTFQFGLIKGEFYKEIKGRDNFLSEFDAIEMENGETLSGTIQISLIDENSIEGEFEFNNGDDTTFKATKVF